MHTPPRLVWPLMIYWKDVCFLARTLKEMAACTALEGKPSPPSIGRSTTATSWSLLTQKAGSRCTFMLQRQIDVFLCKFYFSCLKKKPIESRAGLRKKQQSNDQAKRAFHSLEQIFYCVPTCIGCPLSKQCSSMQFLTFLLPLYILQIERGIL